jgi:4-diphosphocytidyl-2-C-methyl-D-erythritol kinase
MTRAIANAKVNLALHVQPRRADGYHPLHGLFQSIDWSDEIRIETADEDTLDVDGDAPAGEHNLAWQALEAVRTVAGSVEPVLLGLEKEIPPGAGLGGGSADAAAALILASLRFEVSHDDVRRLAHRLGSDVPFALVGGTAIVAGVGELISPQPEADGFALAIVVPEPSLETSAVYRAWDDLGGPAGPTIPETALPPALRDHAPLANDLYPAAVAIAPDLDDWRAELEKAWGVPVSMTGSGSGLFAYFPTLDEATDAVAARPIPARAARAATPVGFGWRLMEERETADPAS